MSRSLQTSIYTVVDLTENGYDKSPSYQCQLIKKCDNTSPIVIGYQDADHTLNFIEDCYIQIIYIIL